MASGQFFIFSKSTLRMSVTLKFRVDTLTRLRTFEIIFVCASSAIKSRTITRRLTIMRVLENLARWLWQPLSFVFTNKISLYRCPNRAVTKVFCVKFHMLFEMCSACETNCENFIWFVWTLLCCQPIYFSVVVTRNEKGRVIPVPVERGVPWIDTFLVSSSAPLTIAQNKINIM